VAIFLERVAMPQYSSETQGKSMLIGYARVSTDDQHCENQVEQLTKAGCKKFYKETASGGRWDRPQLHRALEHLRQGDVLVVWKLDRLSRSLSDLLHIIEKIDKSGAEFKSLTEPIDTTSAIGKMHMQIIGVFAEFERAQIRERTKLGLDRARANGRIGGGRYKLSPTEQAEGIRLVKSGEMTQAEAARTLGISTATMSRMMSQVQRKEQRNGKIL
jgi:DNA invertase Pin-like site-specific DNA recombinase